MGELSTVTVRPTDLSAYEVFRVKADLGNHVTIAIKSTLHPACRIDGSPRWSIHLMLWGDFGPWEHYWSHCGSEDRGWWNWLASTDRDYWLTKMVGDDKEFDLDKSIAMAHKQIEEMWSEVRGDPLVDREDFRQAHYDLRNIGSEHQFFQVVSELDYTREVLSKVLGRYAQKTAMFEEYYGMGYHRPKPRLVWFWDNVWRPFIEQAKANEGFKAGVAA